MTEQEQKRVIVVLSPGRSGSSLLMKSLAELGMRLSQDLIPGSHSNPEGFFEDTQIVQIHKELLESLNTNPMLPMPDEWLESSSVTQAKQKLETILKSRLSESTALWGFKDPRTVSFLPLWSNLLSATGIIPVFLLAIRDPASVVKSLQLQINREGTLTENQWLIRTTESLHYTSADCYIVHYEDWFTRPLKLAKELLQYTGLDQSFNGNLEESMKHVVKPSLNRAAHAEYKIQNRHVLQLYDVLKDCRGSDFDRKRLVEKVTKCRNIMDGFKGWYLEAHKHIGKSKSLQHKLDRKSTKLQRETKRLNKEQKKSAKILAQLESVKRQTSSEIEKLNKHLSNQEQINIAQAQEVDRWKNEAIALKKSYAFRIGEILINAIKKPGKKTLLMPYYLIKILLEVLVNGYKVIIRNDNK